MKTKKIILGLNFGLPFTKNKFVYNFLSYEKVVNNLIQLNRREGVSERSFGEVTSCIKTIVNDNFHSRCNVKHNSRFYNVSSLKNLIKDNNIVVTIPDKGRGVFILNKQDYLKKKK